MIKGLAAYPGLMNRANGVTSRFRAAASPIHSTGSENRVSVNQPEQKEPPPEVLKEWYVDPLCKSASKAMATLLKKGCERHLIEGQLRRIVGYTRRKSGIRMYKGLEPAEAARQLRGCARQLRKVAERIAKLRKTWRLWGRLVEGQSIHLPEQLSEIAERLSRVQTKGYANWNPHREALLDLLERVKSDTGRYHYRELSDLVNAFYAYSALKHGKKMPDELIYDVDSLKMIVSRQRQLDARKYRKSERSIQ